MLDDVEAMFGSIGEAHAIGPDGKNASLKDALRINGLRQFFHIGEPWRNRRAPPRTSSAVPRTSILTEILWLAYFFAIFVGVVYLMVLFVVPHHFNDKIAIALAGLVAGLAMIVTRAWWRKRSMSA
jgi:hypothetical protein